MCRRVANSSHTNDLSHHQSIAANCDCQSDSFQSVSFRQWIWIKSILHFFNFLFFGHSCSRQRGFSSWRLISKSASASTLPSVAGSGDVRWWWLVLVSWWCVTRYPDPRVDEEYRIVCRWYCAVVMHKCTRTRRLQCVMNKWWLFDGFAGTAFRRFCDGVNWKLKLSIVWHCVAVKYRQTIENSQWLLFSRRTSIFAGVRTLCAIIENCMARICNTMNVFWHCEQLYCNQYDRVNVTSDT